MAEKPGSRPEEDVGGLWDRRLEQVKTEQARDTENFSRRFHFSEDEEKEEQKPEETPARRFQRLRVQGERLAEVEKFWQAVHIWNEALEVKASEVRPHEVAQVLEMKAQALMQVNKCTGFFMICSGAMVLLGSRVGSGNLHLKPLPENQSIVVGGSSDPRPSLPGSGQCQASSRELQAGLPLEARRSRALDRRSGVEPQAVHAPQS